MSLRIVIIDDEPFSVKVTQSILEEAGSNFKVIGTAHNITTGEHVIKQTSPDVVLLDIEMPGGNGFDLLKRFEEISFHVIFITAYDQYAIKAFEFSAVDYLLKPYEDERLIEALNKVIEQKNIENRIVKYTTLIENHENLNTLVIKGHDGDKKILLDKLLYLEADSNYTCLHTDADKSCVSSKTLKHYQEILPEKQFFRIHHSIIVNRKFIQDIKQDGQIVILKNDDTLSVSHRKWKFFTKWLANN